MIHYVGNYENKLCSSNFRYHSTLLNTSYFVLLPSFHSALVLFEDKQVYQCMEMCFIAVFLYASALCSILGSTNAFKK
ncbi:MAG: hypothetical protein EXX96DRAFT_553499 [Benjaminiella poitrasii]|nr:MAG: hypothetical protein EXX96DRAFT_553499 [Benjaminiella poitrasii]